MCRAAVTAISAGVSLVCPPTVVAPVHGSITDFFRAPACQWCAGNRGWEISVRAPYVVVSGTDGVVAFAGTVARVNYVVVDTGCGLRITYGRLDAPSAFRAGEAVTRGQVIARSRTLFLGVRAGATRLDPAALWGGPRARLVRPRARSVT